MKIEAIKQNGYSIKYIKNTTEEIQSETIKHEGFAVQYVKNKIIGNEYMDLTKIQLKAIKSVENFAKNSKIWIEK